MKLRLFLSLLTLVSAFVHQSTADVTLVKNGQAQTSIYVPPNVMAAGSEISPKAPTGRVDLEGEKRRRLRDSVNDLALYLQTMSNAKIEIHQRPPQKGEKALPILIGDYAKQRFGEPKQKNAFKQGWRVTVTKDAIGLQGESEEAASYAIYEVLDRLGCRWFLPGKMGEVIPHKQTIHLPETDVSATPNTAYRNVWPLYADEAFRRRNRLGGFHIDANHALEFYITEEQRQQHPEWRAIIGGKPHKKRLKWSNPAVADAIADAIIAKLDKKYVSSVAISPDDGGSFDETDDTALDAGDWDAPMNQVSITDRYIVLCNRIAERVTKKYPEVRLGFLAYVQYTRPPVREKLHPNLVPQIAPINYCRAHSVSDADICPSRGKLREIVEGWGKVAKQVSYYNYMFHLAEVSAPYPMIRQMSEELPLLYKNNVVFWEPETIPNFEEVLPGMWLSLRMAWNNNLDPKQVLNEFYNTFYGAASAPMQRYWEIFDDAWTKHPAHAGSLWSYNRRFHPKVLQAARQTMNEALSAVQTPAEYQRVEMQDRSLRQFERFMQMRTDLNEGRLAKLDRQAMEWLGTQMGLANEYSENYAFSKAGWTPNTVAGQYFLEFTDATYQDAARMARTYAIASAPLRQWKYSFFKNPGGNPSESTFDGIKQGENNGWNEVGFDDGAWKKTDIGMDTWADLDLTDSWGTMWYRQTVKAPKLAEGKKIFLWLAATDGSAKVFVNGQHIPFRNAKGESLEVASGYALPFLFDITSAVKPGADNQITIAGTRTFINELGTGGLIGPAYLFREK